MSGRRRTFAGRFLSGGRNMGSGRRASGDDSGNGSFYRCIHGGDRDTMTARLGIVAVILVHVFVFDAERYLSTACHSAEEGRVTVENGTLLCIKNAGIH